MRIYNLLAALLDYPGTDLLAGLKADIAAAGGTPAFVAQFDNDRLLSGAEREAVAAFLDWLLTGESTEIQAEYVRTFDLTPEHSLHVTHHIFGDDKNRGPALIDLAEYYKTYGYQLADERELPDFLPLMLEFVSLLEADEARVFLADAAKVLNVLAGNLEKAESPWAPLVRAIENQGSLTKLAA
ncbi:MAG: nitrate reductase molybdenum cofactor assembly chaperone [Betaproteobacteria bacterium]